MQKGDVLIISSLHPDVKTGVCRLKPTKSDVEAVVMMMKTNVS
jgi:hypothetical protein